MKLINLSKTENSWLSSIVGSVENILLSGPEIYSEYNDEIDIITIEDIGSLNYKVSPLILRGFGGIQIRKRIDQHKDLILVNNTMMTQARLSEMEKVAVIMHELGHIINDYERVPKMNPMDYYRKAEFTYNGPSNDEINKGNQMNCEFYADNYVHYFGLEKELISSMEKYMRLPNAENSDLFNLRIEKLKSSYVTLKGKLAHIP